MSLRPTEEVEFMNMCMVCDGTKVLALDKVGKNYSGTTFPGGHVEPGELYADSIIREVFEETGLSIKHPVLKGIYHWYADERHKVGLIYRSDEFSGDLRSSEEGNVYWIERAEYEKMELAEGMPTVLRLIDGDEFSEVFMEYDEEGKLVEILK